MLLVLVFVVVEKLATCPGCNPTLTSGQPSTPCAAQALMEWMDCLSLSNLQRAKPSCFLLHHKSQN